LAENKKYKGAWHYAIKDYYNLPEIRQITIAKPKTGAKSRMRIDARDLFKVQSVMVCLIGSDGTMIEKGNAVYDTLELLWYFDFMQDMETQGMKLTVMVLDLPGNIVYRDLLHPYSVKDESVLGGFYTATKKKKYVKSQLRPRPL